MNNASQLKGIQKRIFLRKNPDLEEKRGFVLKSDDEIKEIQARDKKAPSPFTSAFKSFIFLLVCFFCIFTTAGEGKNGGSRDVSPEEWPIIIPTIFILAGVITFISYKKSLKMKRTAPAVEYFACLECDKTFKNSGETECAFCSGKIMDYRFVNWDTKFVKKSS